MGEEGGAVQPTVMGGYLKIDDVLRQNLSVSADDPCITTRDRLDRLGDGCEFLLVVVRQT